MPLYIILFLNISSSEIFIVIAVAFLIFGPQRIPEMARKMGKIMKEIKRVTQDITKEFDDESNSLKKEVKEISDGVNSIKKDLSQKEVFGDNKDLNIKL